MVRLVVLHSYFEKGCGKFYVSDIWKKNILQKFKKKDSVNPIENLYGQLINWISFCFVLFFTYGYVSGTSYNRKSLNEWGCKFTYEIRNFLLSLKNFLVHQCVKYRL